jgi:histidine triad (HIT) family protein
MSENCLFCKILKKEIPSKAVYEDNKVYAFEDISPQAPVHVLVIPKKHIKSINEVTKADSETITAMFEAVKKIAKDKGVAETGYRAVFNVNRDAGMAVDHLHLHMLGGRAMTWPPG